MTLSPFIIDSINTRLRELRDQCSYNLNSVHSYQKSLHHKRTNDYPNKYREKEIFEAGLELEKSQGRYAEQLQILADFIAEHRPVMAPDWIDNDHGRLCWHHSIHGMPIGSYFCQLPEDHAGDHQSGKASWKTPPPPKPKVIAPELDDTGEHGLGADYGQREGPCIIRYQSWTANYHPTRRSHSCLGCKHLHVEPPCFTQLCGHPDFLEKYDSMQSIGGGHWADFNKCLIDPSRCPALEAVGTREHLDQPSPDYQVHLESARPYRRDELEEIFSIPQRTA